MYARSRASNTASASSSHHAAQLNPSRASGDSSPARAPSKEALAAPQSPSASRAQPAESGSDAIRSGALAIGAFSRLKLPGGHVRHGNSLLHRATSERLDSWCEALASDENQLSASARSARASPPHRWEH